MVTLSATTENVKELIMACQSLSDLQQVVAFQQHVKEALCSNHGLLVTDSKLEQVQRL
jgi:hypothetical protein